MAILHSFRRMIDAVDALPAYRIGSISNEFQTSSNEPEVRRTAYLPTS